jgi:hypothetical protein
LEKIILLGKSGEVRSLVSRYLEGLATAADASMRTITFSESSDTSTAEFIAYTRLRSMPDFPLFVMTR